MAMTYEQAMSLLTGPGGPFEIVEADVRGQRMKVFKSTPPSMRAVFDLARTRGDQPFLVYEDEQWSFADVMRHADALGAVLVERYGVKPGDRVSIGMRNYPEWIIAFAAITSVGGVAVLLNAWWTPDEMDYGLRDSGSRVLIADVERIERATDTLRDTKISALVVRSGGATLPDGVDRYEDVVVPGTPMPAVEIGPHDDATILYTSGTTGRPKGAVSTHHAVLSALGAFGCRGTAMAVMNAPEGEAGPAGPPPTLCFILVVPLFHVTGCVAVMLSCFAGGHKLVMMYKWAADRALALIERERVTNFVGVPTQSWDLLECPDFEKHDTSSLAFVGGGGAPAPPELVKRVDGNFRNAAPGIGYGMTETNAYGPQNAGDDYIQRPTSCGRTVPIVEMKVAHDDGVALPPGEVAEIWFRGPNLIRGYWNRPEATAETIVDGWLRSGDIGRIDTEGFVYVQDRAKDMVLRGGENIYCAEVEAAIYEHPAVYEAAVFGVPHERLGEEVAAAVVVKEGHRLEADDLKGHVSERLAAFKVPSIVQLGQESLPRNASGKILKREIRDSIVGDA